MNFLLLTFLGAISSLLGRHSAAGNSSGSVALYRKMNRVGNLTEYVEKIKYAKHQLPLARRGFSRINISPSEKDAYHFAPYAGAAYCDNVWEWKCTHCDKIGHHVQVLEKFTDESFQTVAVLTADDRRKELVLTFRGTSNFVNWIQDLTFFMEDYEYAPEARIHMGFSECTTSILGHIIPKFEQILANPRFSSHSIVIVGHSLGGAMAVLSTLALQREFKIKWRRLSVYTYGQPRVGNTAFANYINSLPLRITRIVNKNDLVPHSPPRSAMYIHHFAEIYLAGNRGRICSLEYLEDPDCSNIDVFELSIDAHLYIWDLHFGRKGCI
ncbi:hypothetical protein DSO57_1026367 [Entomophthora muscae]|uniref:Uncharacterized protein n=1 Tax=Entomophthora muscae TaxID=34485 RepID=A0ACC2T235_9FUNG|nr:hypothetical protein DSO57_1026367 [Entomophthora muscae]